MVYIQKHQFEKRNNCSVIRTSDDKNSLMPARWVIVFASAIILAVCMGVMVNGISAFFIPLNIEFGWNRGAVSFINLSGLAGLAIGGIVMGRIADKSNIRTLCLMGTTIFGLCILALAWANEFWQFCLLFFIAGFLGAGSLFTPLIANIGRWFVVAPGLALGIASAGQAMGQGGIPYGAALLIGEIGWRDTLMTLGVISLVILVPVALFIHSPPVSKQKAKPGISHEENKSPIPITPNITIAWLSLAVIFCCICMSVPLMHLVPLIQDRGFSLENAGSVIFIMLLVAIIGRIFFGKLADMIGALQAYMLASLWQTIMVFGFVQLVSLNSYYIYALVYGFGYSGVMTGILISVSVLTPLSKRAMALGIITLFGWVGHAIGGFQGGYFFDSTSSYILTYANAATAGVINLIIVGSLFITINHRNSAFAKSSLT